MTLRVVLAGLTLIGGNLAAQTPVAFVRDQPDRARDSVFALIRAALRTPPGPREEAAALGRAMMSVWGDTFLTRRAEWLLRLDRRAAAGWLAADSVRRAGNAALYDAGPTAARALWESALRRFEAVGDSAGVDQIRGNIGAGLFEARQLDSAALLLERVRRAATRRGDRRTAANAATILASIAIDKGELRAAADFNRTSFELHRAAGDRRGQAADANTAGLIALAAGDPAGAEGRFRAALAISDEFLGGERAGDYLINLAGVQAQRADLAAARRSYERAAAAFAQAGEPRNEALAWRGLGSLTATEGAFDGAVPPLERAAGLFRASGDVAAEVDARRLLASILGAAGQLDRAFEEIGAASRLLARVAPPDAGLSAAVAVVRGDLELLLNRQSEARTQYEAARQRARSARDAERLAAASQGLALLEQRQERHEAAIRLLEPLLPAQRPGAARAWSLLLLGVSRRAVLDSSGARRALGEALDEYRLTNDRLGIALTLGALADLDVSQRRYAGALRRYAEARRTAAGLDAIAWWLELGAGRALEAAGDLPEAAARYDAAVALVEQSADGIRLDDRRALFLEDKWEAFAAAAALWARRGDADRALLASEQLRARYLLDMLARGRTVPPRERALRREEMRLRRRIHALEGALAQAEAGHRGSAIADTGEGRRDLLAAQTAYRRLIERRAEEEPAQVRGLRGRPVEPAALRRALGAGRVLIEYLVTDQTLWILAATDSATHQIPVAVTRAALRTQVDFARWAIASRGAEPTLARGALAQLDRLLLAPVRQAGLLAGRHTVIVVPHLELHYLPFEALHGDAGYLIQTHDVAYAPSAAAWLELAGRPSRGGRVLALAPLADALPGTGREVADIGAIWATAADVRRGGAASETALRGATGFRIVHLATRGVLDRFNPLLSYVQLAPARGADGRFEVHEVLGAPVATDLLVLTACETALGAGRVADVPNGDDWVGLVRAFLQGGANNVLATLWAVDDRSTASLAADFHRRVAAGSSYIAALGAAKRAALASATDADPYYWAGLVLTGAPAGENR